MYDITLPDGAPAIADVTHYTPEVPHHLSGHPDGWEEGWGPDLEFDVLDADTRKPLTLDLTDQQWEAIETQVYDAIDNDDPCY